MILMKNNQVGAKEYRFLAEEGDNYLDIMFEDDLGGELLMMVGTGEEGTTALNATVTFKDMYLS